MRLIKKVAAVSLLTLSGVALAQVGNNDVLVDPNLVEADELASIPHMTVALVQAVIDGRPYLTAGQLDDVLASASDENQREEIYGHLFRQINLNTASEHDIMLIPGMSSRMTHEFEEYRPYTSLEQFRREIGKYVDDEEVARLEQYVFVPMNLNKSSEETFATIPGITSRMIHEFEEYRPYTSMEQFRREIGKYVDDDEVARLESYVTID